jgi:hypothetical protein
MTVEWKNTDILNNFHDQYQNKAGVLILFTRYWQKCLRNTRSTAPGFWTRNS